MAEKLREPLGLTRLLEDPFRDLVLDLRFEEVLRAFLGIL